MSTFTAATPALFPWYDDPKGIQYRVDQGIADIHTLVQARRDHYETIRTPLRQWLILGSFWLDSIGGVGRLKHTFNEGYPFLPKRLLEANHWKIPSVLTEEQAYQHIHEFRILRDALPPAGAVCDRCGEGWSVHNIEDYIHRDGHRHRRCHRLLIVQRGYDDLKRLLDEAGIGYSELRVIPSGYGPDDLDYYPPWVIAETLRGPIKLGWRKRVISIEWPGTTFKAKGSDIVARPENTHEDTLVHAWGPQEAAECLRKLWAS